MDTVMLSGPEVPPKGGEKAQSLIILLHGLGSDGQDLISLAPFFAPEFPHAHFIAPNAASACDMAPQGYQWFSLRDWTPQRMLAGAEEAVPALNAFIDAQLKRFGLNEDRLALIGFSQGTMMSLHAALRRKAPCAGVVGFSGALLGEHGVTAKPPVCLIHGREDMVVPFAALGMAEAVLQRLDVPVEVHARPGLGHSIDPEGLSIATRFLKSNLA